VLVRKKFNFPGAGAVPVQRKLDFAGAGAVQCAPHQAPHRCAPQIWNPDLDCILI